MNTVFCADRWSKECNKSWKIGVWTNYGIDASGHSNYCAQHIHFLAWADKKPTFKEIKEVFPNLCNNTVMTNKGYKKVKNCDLVIIQEGHMYFSMF